MNAHLKPTLEEMKKFHVLDMMSERQLQLLRDKAIVMNYQRGDIIFSPPRSPSLGYFLIQGCAEMCLPDGSTRRIYAGSHQAYTSLEDQMPARARAVAMQSCRVVLLSRVLIDQYRAWSVSRSDAVVSISSSAVARPTSNNTVWMQPLLSSPLAKNVDPQLMDSLAKKFEEVHVQSGQIIQKKGRKTEHLYIIKAGRARLRDSNNRFRTLCVGAYFGDEALVADAVCETQVEMISAGCVARLKAEDFHRYIKSSFIRRINESQVALMPSNAYVILDVRFPTEFKISHHPNAINIPVGSLSKRIGELPAHRTVILASENGSRGELAAYILTRHHIHPLVMLQAGHPIASTA